MKADPIIYFSNCIFSHTTQIWDTAGQERFRALRTPFYRGSDICLLCYALDDRDSLKGLTLWRNEFLNYADVDQDKFPFIVVGNKNDIPAQKRQVNFELVQQWCADQKIACHIETSSKAATNVTDAFVLGLRQWRHMECVAEAELRQQGDTIDLTRPIRLVQRRICCTGGGEGQAADGGDDAMRSPGSKMFGQKRNTAKAPATNYRL
uniref:Ras-related protein Rab-9A-like n=1 Tax=Drosophila rhopaloa TaxID=1041015 RepID=A0A6P4ELN3_DRORH